MHVDNQYFDGLAFSCILPAFLCGDAVTKRMVNQVQAIEEI